MGWVFIFSFLNSNINTLISAIESKARPTHPNHDVKNLALLFHKLTQMVIWMTEVNQESCRLWPSCFYVLYESCASKGWKKVWRVWESKEGSDFSLGRPDVLLIWAGIFCDQHRITGDSHTLLPCKKKHSFNNSWTVKASLGVGRRLQLEGGI